MNKLAKKLVAAVLAAFASSSVLAAADSYLYWMVDSDAYNYLDGTKSAVDYKYARVNVGGTIDENGNVLDGTGTWLNPYVGNSPVTDGSGPVDYLTKAAATSGPLYWGVFDSTLVAGSTFIFELFNESNEVVGWYSASYGDLVNSIATGSDPSGSAVFRLTGVVPEPTSGLLSLFGLAMLALRRRRA